MLTFNLLNNLSFIQKLVYLDVSKASMAIAKKRVDLLGLRGITWINDRIENIPLLDLGGKFDFIETSGVLHHLEDPQDGLKLLSNVLKENGGMSLMVYGRWD